MATFLLLIGAVLCGCIHHQSSGGVSADEVFASSAQLRLLADGERRLVDALDDYLTAERRRLLLLDQSADTTASL